MQGASIRLDGRLLSRFLKMSSWRAHQEDLDDATLGKPGHVVMPHRVSILPSPSLSSAPHSVRPLQAPAGVVGVGQPVLRMRPNANLQVCQSTSTENALSFGRKQWPEQYKSLLKSGIKNITGDDAIKMANENGAVIVDVRPVESFEEDTLEGAISVPITREIPGDSMKNQISRLVAYSTAVRPMEGNPDFITLALERLPKQGPFLNKPIIIMCDRGGKLEVPSLKGTAGGKSDEARVLCDTDRFSLSLRAGYSLTQVGFKNLYFIGEGYGRWKQSKIPKTKPPYWQAFFIR